MARMQNDEKRTDMVSNLVSAEIQKTRIKVLEKLASHGDRDAMIKLRIELGLDVLDEISVAAVEKKKKKSKSKKKKNKKRRKYAIENISSDSNSDSEDSNDEEKNNKKQKQHRTLTQSTNPESDAPAGIDGP